MGLRNFIYQKAVQFKSGTEHLAYGRPIICNWAVEAASKIPGTPRILDIGCGHGDDLLRIKESLNDRCELFAVEAWEPYRRELKDKGIEALGVDIEREPFPWDDDFFDVISINQVMEHTKEIFWILGEISRILKPGGTLIIGVPNLAAWHDRLMLLLGMEPSNAHMLGGHIRGITKQGMQKVLQADDFWKIKAFAGSGFYPFPASVAKPLAKFLPNLATSIFFQVQRTGKEGHFSSVLDTRFFETNYRKV